MRSVDEIIEAVADAKGVTTEELALARDNLAIYSDGECWMLTNGGRVRLRQIRGDRELGGIMEKCTTDATAISGIPPAPTPVTNQVTAPASLDNHLAAIIQTYATCLSAPITDTAIATPVSAKDTQIGGDHYKKLGRYQPWEVLAHWLTPEELRGYAKGTAIAYFAREQDKGGDQDIAKGIHTLQLWQEVRKDK